MAETYLQAMEHSHFHSKAVLKKRAQKRALGAIENEYNYRPPQPVLSCRTVNIDLTGTRTYRSKSAMDIIGEQHQFIQHVYTATRSARSAPQKRISSKNFKNIKKPDNRNIKFLSVTNTPSLPSTRPQSQLSIKSRVSMATSRSVGRSSTSDAYWRNSPQSVITANRYLQLTIDPDLQASCEEYKTSNGLLHQQWAQPFDDTDYSQALVGTGLHNTKGNTQWLSFAGSQREKCEGIIDSFTAMKDEYFSIDSNTGSHVAKQLNKGDKIRIGVNGEEGFLTRRKRTETKEKKKKRSILADSPPPEVVPLCWTDQMSWNNTKVLEPKSPRQPTPPANLCESYPVVFKKLIGMETREANIKHGQKVSYNGVDGFKIKSRSKTRKGIDGRESQNSTITNITIDQRTEFSDDEIDNLSVEDILERKIGHRRKEQKIHYGEATVTSLRGDSASTMGQRHVEADEDLSDKKQPVQEKRRSSNTANGSAEPILSSAKGERGRPFTAHSAASIDPNIEALCVVPNGENNANLNKDLTRQTSGKRPPPAKPSLHKSSAATGSSTGNQQNGDASYIQIVQPLDIGTEKQQPTSESPTMKVIHSVKQYNDMSSNHSIPPPSSPTGETTKDIENNEQSTNQQPVRSVSPTKELLAKAEPTPTTKYAFNIPTAAEMMSDSTFSDHDTVFSEEHGEMTKTFALSKPRQTPVQEEEGEDDQTPRTTDGTKPNDIHTQIIDSTA